MSFADVTLLLPYTLDVFYFFSCLIALSRTSSAMLIRSSKSKNIFVYSKLRGKAFSLWPFVMIPNVGFCRCTLLNWWNSPLSLLRWVSLSRGSVRFYGMLFLHQLGWCGFYPLFYWYGWCITLIDVWMWKPWISGVNSISSWCIIFFYIAEFGLVVFCWFLYLYSEGILIYSFPVMSLSDFGIRVMILASKSVGKFLLLLFFWESLWRTDNSSLNVW